MLLTNTTLGFPQVNSSIVVQRPGNSNGSRRGVAGGWCEGLFLVMVVVLCVLLVKGLLYMYCEKLI